jgi:enoyl-CoA hydratase/carnithine racemase
MEYKEILFEEKGSVAHLTLNRPDIRNAITGETIINEIEDVCHQDGQIRGYLHRVNGLFHISRYN